MSPWIDDPDTGTSHYEKPKRRSNRELQREALEAAGKHDHDHEPAPSGIGELAAGATVELNVESFGQRMARLKAEKAQAKLDAEAVIRKLESLEVQGS